MINSRHLILEKIRSAGIKNKNRLISEPNFSNTNENNLDELLKIFINKAENVNSEVYELDSEINLDKKINEIFEESEIERFIAWNTDFLNLLKIDAKYQRIDENLQKSEISEAHIGLTEADFAIADTGTLVLLSNQYKPRLTSLLPQIHMAILKKENLLSDIHQLFNKLKQDYVNSDNLCSCISFITGPSRTADIELNLTLGVHGPKKLIILII
ncbi:MAG: LutC/YkgG family protein [Thermodesulfobacteriota bacterium]